MPSPAIPLTGSPTPWPSSIRGRIALTLRAVAEDVRLGSRTFGPRRSRLRWAVDVLLYRLLSVTDAGLDRPRTVTTRDGTALEYRLNRGDIIVVLEIWLLEAYRLPAGARAATVVDLGANIGLTSLWLAANHDVERIVAVEPVPENAAIARRNLARTGAATTLLQAAVGAADGTARFRGDRTSTVGATADASGGYDVPVLSMDSVLGHLPPDARIDLLKMDIEGGEGDVVCGDLGWLDRCDRIVAEIHPDATDAPRVVERICRAGFTVRVLPAERPYAPKGSEYMAWFERTPA